MSVVVITVAGVIVLWEILEFLYRHTSAYRRSLGNVGKMLEGVPDGLDVANIGSGPGLYAIDYAKCRKRGFNFSTAPQSYKYGFRLLKRYKGKINPGAIIIIIMCPLSFGKNNDYDRPGYSDRFYPVLPPEEIDGYSLKRVLITRHALLKRCVSLSKRILRRLIKRKKPGGDKSSAELPIITGWKGEFDLHDLVDASQADAHREAFAEKIGILNDILAFCAGQQWRPIFVIPPMPEKVMAEISDDFLKAFVFDNLDKISGVDKLDYHNDKRIAADDFTGSSVFLNKKGREKFSAILFEEVGRTMGVEL